MIKQRSKLVLLLLVCLTLVACGGGGSASEEPQPSGVVEPPKPPEQQQIDVSGTAPVQQVVAQKVAGRILRQSDIVEVGQLNSTGGFLAIGSNGQFNGNVSASISVADEDGIARVFVTFNAQDAVTNLCRNCGTEFSGVVIGLSPLAYGLNAGQHNFQVWVEDNDGNVQLVDSRAIVWSPRVITGVTAELGGQSGEVINLSWSGVAGVLRYNVYFANESGVNQSNYSQLDGGGARLSLTQTSVVIENSEASENYYLLVSAVDGSGENVFSEQVEIINDIASALPELVSDEAELAEDTNVVVDILANDTPNDVDFEILITTEPQSGTVQITEDNELSYTPNEHFFGTDQLVYQLTTSQGLSAETSVSFTINSVNDAPIAVEDLYVIETGANSLVVSEQGVLANDIEVDGEAAKAELTAQQSSNTQFGELVFNQNGTFTYTANSNFVNYDEFTYTVTDAEGASSTATVSIQTPDFNGYPPISVPDNYQLVEDELLQVSADNGLLANDFDNDDDLAQVTLAVVSTPSKGVLTLSSDGSFSYAPNKDANGSDVFVYSLTDSDNNSTQASVSFQIQAVNDVPVATADSYSFNFGSVLAIDADLGILANDFDVDEDDTIRVVLSATTAPTSGVLNLLDTGAFVYTPEAEFTGTDSFEYVITDGTVESAVTTVQLHVLSISTDIDDNSTLALNDFFDIPATLTLTAANFSANRGSVEVINDIAVYTPEVGYAGRAVVTFTYTDEDGESISQTLFIEVEAIDRVPVFSSGNEISVSEAISTNSIIYTAVATDPLNDSIVYSLVESSNKFQIDGTSGELTLRSGQSLDYEQQTEHSLVIKAENSSGYAVEVDLLIKVINIDEVPTGLGDIVVNVAESIGEGAVIHSYSVRDPEGGAISYSLLESSNVIGINSSSGVVSLFPAARLDYESQQFYQFTVEARDNGGNSIQASLQIFVSDVDEAPEFSSSDAFSQPENIQAGSLLHTVSATDPEGSAVSMTLTGEQDTFDFNSGNGQLTLKSGAVIDYELKNSYSIPISASDDNGNTAQQIVTFNVTNINEAPILSDISPLTSVTEGTVSLFQVTATDPEGLTVSYSLSGQDAGSFVLSSTGELSFASQSDFENPTDQNQDNQYEFSIVASDLSNPELTDSASISVVVENVDEAPVFGEVEDTATVPEGTNEAINFAASDPEGDTVTYNISGVDNALFTITSSGQLSFVNPPDYESPLDSGQDNTYSITITALDQSTPAMSTALNASIVVTNANESPVIVSQAPSSATEDEEYEYIAQVEDPDDENDGVQLSWSLQGAPEGMTVSNLGVVNWTPPGDINETYTFQLSVADGGEDNSQVATEDISIELTSVDDAPIAEGDSATVNQGESVNFSWIANDTDEEGDEITFGSFASVPQNGSVTANSDGTFTYVHDNGTSTSDQFSYFIQANGQTSESPATVEITIIPNTPPVINSPSSFSIVENTAASTLVYTATVAPDPEDDEIDWTIISDSLGIFSINNNGEISVANNANLDFESNPTHTISIRAQDDSNGTDTLTISMTITDIDEAPKVAANISVSVNENHATSSSAGLVATAVDPEGDAYTMQLEDPNGVLTSCPALFSLVESPTGTYTLYVDNEINFEDLITNHSGYDEDASSSTFSYTMKLKATQTSDASLYTEQDLTVIIVDEVENTELSMVPAFDDDGFKFFNSYSDVENNEYLIDAKLDSDNHTYALIKAENSTSGDEFIVAKYKAGELDTGFGFNGIKHVFTYFQNDKNVEQFTNASSPDDLTAYKLIVHDDSGSAHDGKVYIVGSESTAGVTTPFVIRLDADGNLDKTFDTDGKFDNSTLTNVTGIDLLVHSNGKLYFAMNTINSGIFQVYVEALDADTGASLGAYGSYDFSAGYGTYGKTLFENSSGELVSIGYIDSNGNFDVYAATLSETLVDVAASVVNNSVQIDVKDISINSSYSKDVIFGAIKLDATDAILFGSTDYKSSTHQDSMLLKLNLDTLSLYGDSDTECTVNNNCFGSEDANSDTIPDGVSIINMSAGNTDEAISAAVNNNGDISFIAKALDSTKYPLTSYQVDSVGIATAAASAMAGQELAEKVGSSTGGVADGNIHAVVLHDVNDTDNNIHIISSKEVDNPQGSEIETWITQYDSAGSSDLDGDTVVNDVAIINDHIASTTTEFKMLLEPINDGSANQYFYGFSQIEHAPGISGLSIDRFSKSTGANDSTFNGDSSSYEWLPDVTNNKSYTLGGQVILADQTVVTAVLEDDYGVQKIIIIRRNADGSAYTGADLPSGKVEFSKPGFTILSKLVYDESNDRLYVIGADDEFADAGKTQTLAIGIDLTDWSTLFHVNIDVLNNDDDNAVLDAETLSDGSLVLVGGALSGVYNHGFAVKLKIDVDGNATDNILGLSGTIGDLEMSDTFDGDSGDSDNAITLDLTANTADTIIKQVEVTSDNSLIFLVTEDSNTTDHLFKYSPNGSSEFVVDTSFNDEYEALYSESLPMGNINVRLSKLSSSGLTGEALVFDMKVMGDNLWFTGTASFGELGKAFVAKLDASTGNAEGTFGQFGLQPGYFVPYARQDCTGVVASYSNICNIPVFTNIHITSSGRAYVSGIYPSIDNKVDVFIIKFKEAQNDTGASYTIDDGG